MLLTEKTFLGLPVYRSPFFPVFFYVGKRRYIDRDPSTCFKHESHIGTLPSSETMDPLLVRILQELNDQLIDTCNYRLSFMDHTRDLRLARQIESMGKDVVQPSYISRFFKRSKSLLLLGLSNIFTRRHGRDHRSHEIINQSIIINSAPYSPPGRSHLNLPNWFRSGRDSSCLSGITVGDDSDVLVEIEPSVPAVISSVTNTQPTHPHLQTSSDPVQSERSSSCLPPSHSVPSLSQTTSAKNKTFTRSKSSPDLLFKPSCEEFTPDITVDENDETYRFQCSCPGLYQCSVTGLLFHMEGEGDVVYRIVPWNRRLLARHHKQPAGPLFDIKCLQQSVCQLHLPHCEIRSTGGCEFMSVAHVNDEGIEFIGPQKITETHLVINITGFSGFGNVKDEVSPPDPVRALVLLFYRPPADPDAESLLNVLLLPRNVVLRDVLRTRKKLNGDEIYIETSPHCKLQPKQEHTLSTCPADDSVLVQPTEAEFDCDNYDNYFPSLQVTLETMRKHMQLFLRDTNSSHSVWERRVCLTGVKSSCGPSALNLSSDKRLLDVRSSFIDGISGPVLKSLLDKLFEKTVIAEAERESADEMQNRRDKARFVIDTVRKKGEAASSEMIEFLCEADPFLCEHLGLI